MIPSICSNKLFHVSYMTAIDPPNPTVLELVASNGILNAAQFGIYSPF